MVDEYARVARLSVEMQIRAQPDGVWSALTKEIGRWWPAEMYSGGEHGMRTFVMEAFPGGRMFEDLGEGGGVLWGTVVYVEPNARLQVFGTLFPNWGGPSEWYGTWQLESENGGTKVTFTEVSVGRISQASTEEKQKGWDFLGRTLKAFVEGAPPPAWDN